MRARKGSACTLKARSQDDENPFSIVNINSLLVYQKRKGDLYFDGKPITINIYVLLLMPTN
uniref:Uncharacterized protein n=1 Tax=Rhizophora mucronata TaxID=61149 RepID=A0A2P2N4Z5_RHIMU